MALLRGLLRKSYCLENGSLGLINIGATITGNPLPSRAYSADDKTSSLKLNNVVSQLRQRVQKSSAVQSRPVTRNELNEDEPKIEKPKKENGAVKHEKRKITSGKEDPVCDKRIRELISKGGGKLEDIAPELEKYYDLDCYPSRKTLEVLASIYSKDGNVDGVVYVQRACAKMYPKEYSWMMGYEHYLAEAKWKGQCLYKESIDMFSKMFVKYPLRRRKICNMTKFLMCHVLDKMLEDEYPHLTTFARVCAELDNFDVASNLWRASFLCRTVRGQQIGRDLMEKYPPLRPLVQSKFEGLIEVAYERNDIDILQRLVQAALESQLTESYTLVLGALLNFQCESEDLKGAMETFRYSSREKVILPASTVQRLMALLAQQKKEAPSQLLDSKYKPKVSDRFQIKW